jgi:hypothetical protein
MGSCIHFRCANRIETTHMKVNARPQKKYSDSHYLKDPRLVVTSTVQSLSNTSDVVGRFSGSSSISCLDTSSSISRPMDGGHRRHSSSTVFPHDHKSARMALYRPSRTTSGAVYPVVPTMPRTLCSIPLTRKDVLKSMINRRPPLRGIKMFCGFRSMCATPCRCMKSTASNNCLATDHKCISGFSIPVSHPPAVGIDMAVPPSTGQIRTPVMVWFAEHLIPVKYSISLRPSCTNFRCPFSDSLATLDAEATRGNCKVYSNLSILHSRTL